MQSHFYRLPQLIFKWLPRSPKHWVIIPHNSHPVSSTPAVLNKKHSPRSAGRHQFRYRTNWYLSKIKAYRYIGLSVSRYVISCCGTALLHYSYSHTHHTPLPRPDRVSMTGLVRQVTWVTAGMAAGVRIGTRRLLATILHVYMGKW